MRTRAALLLLNKKGYCVLRDFIKEFGSENIEYVVSNKDKHLQEDYYNDIRKLCSENNIKFCKKDDSYSFDGLSVFAVGWRWLIGLDARFHGQPIIFHDSLLPRYRGFAPLVAQLINKENCIGVTGLYAAEEFDKGEIVQQAHVDIKYPIKISEAIDKIIPLYSTLVIDVFRKILSGESIKSFKQNESEATYSLWRDEEDYKIDWRRDSEYIKRFIDAVSYPYLGAFSFNANRKIRIFDAEIQQDLKIEDRHPGKVILINKSFPVVVCGNGLLKLVDVRDDETQKSIFPLKMFRTRFI